MTVSWFRFPGRHVPTSDDIGYTIRTDFHVLIREEAEWCRAGGTMTRGAVVKDDRCNVVAKVTPPVCALSAWGAHQASAVKTMVVPAANRTRYSRLNRAVFGCFRQRADIGLRLRPDSAATEATREEARPLKAMGSAFFRVFPRNLQDYFSWASL